MTEFRTEKDLLGECQVPAEALYGVHTQRALENFALARRPVNPALIHAYGAVKLACCRANRELGHLPAEKAQAIENACLEMMAGGLDQHVPVDALQGGAGTSTNMNVNEVLANRALEPMGRAPGDYDAISPLQDVNLHQSTNDTYPSALKVAAITLLRSLESELVALQEAFQDKEKAFSHVVKVGRTQMQDAALVTLGREMSAYAEAFARDRWRIHKCEERLRVVNLGGTAVGTGIGAPREYIFRVAEELKEITGFGLARADNLVEATQNADVFVEVSGLLKTCASNLLKVSGDLRLLSSGPDAGLGELYLPPRQSGSSIMPGKVNPVIPEAVSHAALVAIGNDQVLTTAAGLGSLELNPFMPLIADALLSSLDLLSSACSMLRRLCVEGITADEERCRAYVDSATATATALVDEIGYEAAEELAVAAEASGAPIGELAVSRGLLSRERFEQAVSAESVTRLGSRPRKDVP
jgi:aspartate ammonia-lyase